MLSFPATPGKSASPSVLLGDVVISLETARRQAKKMKLPLREELLRLLIHGVLHLLGYDHENVAVREVRRMEKAEVRLFELLAAG